MDLFRRRLLEHREVLQVVRTSVGVARIVRRDTGPWREVDAELAVREDRVPQDAVLDRGHAGDEVSDTDADVPVVGDDVPSPGGHSADLVVRAVRDGDAVELRLTVGTRYADGAGHVRPYHVPPYGVGVSAVDLDAGETAVGGDHVSPARIGSADRVCGRSIRDEHAVARVAQPRGAGRVHTDEVPEQPITARRRSSESHPGPIVPRAVPGHDVAIGRA